MLFRSTIEDDEEEAMLSSHAALTEVAEEDTLKMKSDDDFQTMMF